MAGCSASLCSGRCAGPGVSFSVSRMVNPCKSRLEICTQPAEFRMVHGDAGSNRISPALTTGVPSGALEVTLETVKLVRNVW